MAGPMPQTGNVIDSRAPIQRQHVVGVRKVLREHGYDVSETGALTPRLLTAWRNYRRNIQVGTGGRGTGDNAQTGALSVKDWNSKHARVRPSGGPAGARGPIGVDGRPLNEFNGLGRIHAVDNPNLHQTHTAAHVKARAKTHASKLGAGGGSGNQTIPGVNSDVNSLIGGGMADTIAGQQFDPQIHGVNVGIAQNPADEAQHQGDIGNWYGQVQGSLGTAAQRDTEASGAAQNSIKNAVAGIVSSLGGSQGAGLVGASGVNALAQSAAEGSSQDRYNADLAPLLKAEEAGAHSREAASGSQRLAELKNQLLDLQGQRGQAKSKAAMDITAANNAARQQNFGNKLAIQNASLAAQSLGLDATKVAASIAQAGLDNKLTKAKIKAANKGNTNPTWAQLTPPDRQQVINAAVGQSIKQHSLGGATDWDAVTNSAREILRGMGYSSARSLGYKGRIPSRGSQASILNLLTNAIATAQAQSHNAQQ